MSKYFKETMRNAQEFYKNTDCSIVAKTFDSDGFVGIYEMADRPYFFVTKIEEDNDVAYMEISPCILCRKEAVGQMSEYMSQINEKFMTCNFRVADNGKVYIHTEQRFDDGPISTSTFGFMEMECIKRLDAFESVLDKLANLRLLTPEEADVNKVLEKHNEKIGDIIADAFARIEKEIEEKKSRGDKDEDCDVPEYKRLSKEERAENIRDFLERQREKRNRNGKPALPGGVRFDDIVDRSCDDKDD